MSERDYEEEADYLLRSIGLECNLEPPCDACVKQRREVDAALQAADRAGYERGLREAEELREYANGLERALQPFALVCCNPFFAGIRGSDDVCRANFDSGLRREHFTVAHEAIRDRSRRG